MIALSKHIIENCNSLEYYFYEYPVDEGLCDYIKRFYKWLTKSTNKNIDKNNGNYVIPKRIIADLDNTKSNIVYNFCPLDDKNADRILNTLGDNFYISQIYHSRNKQYNVFLVQAKKPTVSPTTIGVLFCSTNTNILSIHKIIFSQEIIQTSNDIANSAFVDNIIKTFIKWFTSTRGNYTVMEYNLSNLIDKTIYTSARNKKTVTESIDDENIQWKLDTYFQRDSFQKSLFNALFIDGDIDKAVSDGFDIKSFVNFITDDINPSLDKDYKYQTTKIINLLRAKNYAVNKPKL